MARKKMKPKDHQGFCPVCGSRVAIPYIALVAARNRLLTAINDATPGAVQGAQHGSKVGIAAGGIGAVSGTLAGAVMGGLATAYMGTYQRTIRCHNCKTSFKIVKFP